MIRIRNVKPLDRFRVRIELTNGKKKTIDLEPFLHGPIFEPIRRNPTLFRSVKVDEELGTIVWDNGADIDPDVLIGRAIPEVIDREQSGGTKRKLTEIPLVKESSDTYQSRKRKK